MHERHDLHSKRVAFVIQVLIVVESVAEAAHALRLRRVPYCQCGNRYDVGDRIILSGCLCGKRHQHAVPSLQVPVVNNASELSKTCRVSLAVLEVRFDINFYSKNTSQCCAKHGQSQVCLM